MILPACTRNTEANVAVLLCGYNSKNTSRILPGFESLGEAKRFSPPWTLWHRVAHFHKEVGKTLDQYYWV